VWTALAVAFAIAMLTERIGRRLPTSAVAFGTLAVLWGSLIVGAGAYYDFYADLIANATGVRIPIVSARRSAPSVEIGAPDPGRLAATLTSFREGFIDSGGDTNLQRRGYHADRRDAAGIATDIGVGLGAMFVPISVLRALSLVSFSGGRGFLTVADIDTLFIDVSLLVVCALLWRARPLTRKDVVSLSFLVALTVLTAVLIAYTVTNFGTLFRLRMMVVVPAWMVPLAVTNAWSSRQREVAVDICAE